MHRESCQENVVKYVYYSDEGYTLGASIDYIAGKHLEIRAGEEIFVPKDVATSHKAGHTSTVNKADHHPSSGNKGAGNKGSYGPFEKYGADMGEEGGFKVYVTKEGKVVYEDVGNEQCGVLGDVRTIDKQEEGKVIGKGKDISYEEFKRHVIEKGDFKARENKIKYGFSPITGKMNQELGDLTYNSDNDKNIDGYLRESYEIYLKKGSVSTSELGLMGYSLIDFYLEGNAEKKEEVASALLKNKEVKLEEYYHNKQYETGQISSPTELFLSDGFIRSAHQIKKWVLVGESVWVETSPGSYVLTNLATSDVIKSIKTGDKALENVPIYGFIWQGAKWVPIKFYNALPDFIKTAVDMWVIPEGLLLTKNIVKSVIAKEGGTALKPAFYSKADSAGAREILIPDAGDLNKKVFTKPDEFHSKIPVVEIIGKESLNQYELSNLKRFEQKLPNADKTIIEKLQNGDKIFRAEVQGKVPGSKAMYEKTINSKGETIKYDKITYAPDGSIIHTKDKFNNK
jgi:hypothetical protein